MTETKFIEITLFKTKEGVNQNDFQTDMKQWNKFLAKHNGFLARKIAVSPDGYWADINYWANLDAPKTWFNEENAEMVTLFESNMAKIDETTLSDTFFEINNEISIESGKATIADLFFMNLKENVSRKVFESAMIKFNHTLVDYKGLVLRENGVAEDGKYLELVYWTDVESANSASEKGIEDTEIESFFDMTDEETLFSNRFEIFSDTEINNNEDYKNASR